MEARSLRVLCVLPVLGHPKDSKRITMLQAAGFSVEAVSFERDHQVARLPDCSVELLGKIVDETYLLRVPVLLAAIPILRRAIRRNDVVYALGSDMAVIALLAGLGTGRPVIQEAADIQRVQVATGVKGRVVRLLDRYGANRSKLLVVTAAGFVDGYYRRRLRTKTPTLLMENKLEAATNGNDSPGIPATLSGRPLIDRPLRIGYFGVLRCDWSWRVLEALASSRPSDVEILVAGTVTTPVDLGERAAKLRNVDFRGGFSSPEDLPQLYGSVDIVWACYPSPEVDDADWRWAQSVCRSNRFYESCYFSKPIITMANSADSVDVARYGIGVVLHDHSVESIWHKLSGIGPLKWADFQTNVSRLPRSVYTYTTETDELATAVAQVATAGGAR